MSGAALTVRRASEMAGQAADVAVGAAVDAWEATRDFLATEQGRRVRHRVAAVVIVAAPLLSEFPILRKTPAGRLLRVAGAGALLVRGARWLRDWDPST